MRSEFVDGTEHLASWRFALVLIVMLAILMTLTSGVMVVAIACAAVSLTGTRQAIGAITAILLMNIANPGLAIEEEAASSVGWIALILASARIWLDTLTSSAGIANLLPKFTRSYLATIVILSLIASTSPTVSVLKAVSFLIVMSALVMGITLNNTRGTPAAPWFISLWLVVLFLSIPTLAIPEIGYLRDGLGFQGILNHPQGLAVFLAPLAVWALVMGIGARDRKGAGWLIIFFIALAMMWLTRGRTGFAAMVLAFILLLAVRPNFFRLAIAIGRKVFGHPLMLGAVLLAIALVIVSGVSVGDLLVDLIFKGYDADNLTEAYGQSRGFIVDQAMINFQARPLTGIGFGVSNSFSYAFNIEIDPLTGLPISATTEKANLVLAVVEETGIVGTVMFAPFLISLILRLARSPDLAVAAAGMTALCTNVSEMTFFSFGGIGLYTWLIIGWALADYTATSPSGPMRPQPVRTSQTVAA